MFISNAIPRGIIYHRVMQDLSWLAKSLFVDLNKSPQIAQFEDEFATYMGRKHCIAFPSARIALYYSLKSLKLSEGSEIIMPPITIKGILDVVIDLGLKPVFVDLDPETLYFDIDLLRKTIGDNTKVSLITYLFGIVPDIEQMVRVFKAHNVYVLEDFSQCLDGMYNDKKVGGFGDIGIYSASSTKTLDTYGGGLLVCDEVQTKQNMQAAQGELFRSKRLSLINKIIIDLIRNLATTRLIFSLFTFPFIRIMARMRPGNMLKHTGERNKEMIKTLPVEWFLSYSSFQAEMGGKWLKEVHQANKRRVKNVLEIKQRAGNTNFPKGTDRARNIYWRLLAYFDEPYRAQAHLNKNGIDTSITSLELISNLSAYPTQGITPVAKNICNNGLFIPCYPSLGSKDIDRICHALNSYSV